MQIDFELKSRHFHQRLRFFVGYMQLLSQLTVVGDVSRDQFIGTCLHVRCMYCTCAFGFLTVVKQTKHSLNIILHRSGYTTIIYRVSFLREVSRDETMFGNVLHPCG